MRSLEDHYSLLAFNLLSYTITLKLPRLSYSLFIEE